MINWGGEKKKIGVDRYFIIGAFSFFIFLVERGLLIECDY